MFVVILSFLQIYYIALKYSIGMVLFDRVQACMVERSEILEGSSRHKICDTYIIHTLQNCLHLPAC